MPFIARVRIFVDESKAKGYILAATAAQPREVVSIERQVRALVLPGQRRIHFKSESNSRRREVLSRLAALAPRVTIYAADAKSDKVGRALTLAEAVKDAVRAGAGSLAIEADESLVVADRRFIRARLVALDAVDALSYEHVAPGTHPLLWVSDAVAWCVQAGGDWRRRADPLIEELKQF